MRYAILTSTSGSVAKYAILNSPSFKSSVKLFVSDRQCKGLEVGSHFGIETLILPFKNRDQFSNNFCEKLLEYKIDYVFVFFDRILSGTLLEKYKYKIINFHPSLLPAHPGLNGFEDSIASGSKLIGSTAHYIDAGVDTGTQIIQSLVPVNPNQTKTELRHKIFTQQVKSLIQINHWLQHKKLDKNLHVLNACYEINEFIPNLDSEEAINCKI